MQCAQRQQRPFTASRASTSSGRRPGRFACSAVSQQQQQSQQQCHADERSPAFPELLQRAGAAALSGLLTVSILASGVGPAAARPAGVNRPELLPSKPNVPVIDVAGFLTPSEESKLASEVTSLERDTGIRVRVLAQNYPETPGLAIKDYWGVDESFVVLVADPNFGDILNFNVGEGVDLAVPRSFWGRLAGKYGNKFYWQEKGEAAAIMNAVSAIDVCLREPEGRGKCAAVASAFDE